MFKTPLVLALALAPMLSAAAQETFTYFGPVQDQTVSTQPFLSGPPLQASDGNFYAAWDDGNGGRIERVDVNGNVTVIYAFGTTGPNSPVGNLIQGVDGYLYGQLNVDPVNHYGDFYKIALDGSNFTVLYAFNLFGDAGPAQAGLTLGSDGNFYGIGNSVPLYAGFAPPVHSPDTAPAAGTRPHAGLAPSTSRPSLAHPSRSDGNRSNTIPDGNPGNCEEPGTSFYQLTPAGAMNVYLCVYGNDPLTGVTGRPVQAADGNFYAFTLYSSSPEIVQLDTLGDENTLGPTTPSGGYSNTTLVGGPDGNFYTTLVEGDCGDVLQINPYNNYSTLTTALDCSSIEGPDGALSIGTDANLYGAALTDPNYDAGAIYKYNTPYNSIDIVHQFNGITAGEPTTAPAQASDGNFYGDTAQSDSNISDNLPTYYRLSVSPALAPPVTVTAPVQSLTAGTPVTFTITILNASPITPTVCVALMDNAPGPSSWSGILTPPDVEYNLAIQHVTFTPAASGPLSDYELSCQGSGSAIATYLAPPASASNISFSVAPSLSFVTGTAATLTATVTQANGGCGISRSGKPVPQGCSVHPDSGPIVPTGTVTFTAGDYAIGTANLVSGTATLPVSTDYLKAGTYTVKASYSGDSHYDPASTTQTVTINGLATTLSFAQHDTTTSSSTITAGDSIEFTANLISASGAAPGETGPVGFYIGKSLLCSANVTGNGTASCTLPTTGLPAGSAPVYAAYAGDSYHAASQSSAHAVTLQKAATTTTLSVSLTNIDQGQQEQFTGTVTSATTTPTGEVNFTLFGHTLCSAPVTSGTATCSITVPTRAILATYPVYATYTGNADSASSTSPVVDVTVHLAP
jgi:hypothetical protein